MTIRENLLALRERLEAEPESAIDLDAFVTNSICGTLHCTLGLASTMPRFAAMGIWYNPGVFWGFDKMRIGDPPDDESCHTSPKLDRIFGQDAYDRVFEAYGNGDWDTVLGAVPDDDEKQFSDKELALKRIDKQLEQYP